MDTMVILIIAFSIVALLKILPGGVLLYKKYG